MNNKGIVKRVVLNLNSIIINLSKLFLIVIYKLFYVVMSNFYKQKKEQ